MRNGDDWHGVGMPGRFILRLILAIVVIAVVFTIIGIAFKQIDAMGIQATALPAWFWDLVGLFTIIWVISWVFRFILGGPWWYHRHWPLYEDRAERILRRRYARGEIGREQYRRMMKDLEEHSH